MSDTTTNTTSSECDKLLDYVYGELDDAGKRAFEEHLPTCARCQDDVAKLGRVRTAAKRVLPSVEPPASLGGALHAQLMHAAAQRKPRRGILLAFPRKIVEHPALSAAAMFVIVGGFFAYNWSQGKIAMPAAEHAEVDTPKPTEAEVPAKREATAEAAPAAAEPMPAAKNKEAALDNEGAADNKPSAGQAGEDKTQLALQTPQGSYTVQRPTAHHAGPSTGTIATAAPKKLAPPRMKGIAVDGKLGKRDSLDDLAQGSKDEMNGFGSVSRGAVGGAGGGRIAANEAAKSSAPAGLSRKTMTEEKAAAQAPAAPPPPTVVMSTPAPAAAPSRDYYRVQSQVAEPAPQVAKPSANARAIDQLRKQADDDAKSGRCDDAIKRYQELDKSGTYISPTERVNWVRCLNQRGRQEEAQQRLDELKQEKKITNAQIQDVERELNDSRRRVESKKAKKASAPADRAPATEATTQQKRAEPPAQTPPDSTNTKVKPSSAY